MMTRRLLQLLIGLALYGVSLAMVIRASLGTAPWDVFHQGLAGRTGLSLGTVVIIVSFLVLLLWIPLRQWPGVGTVCNAVLVGVFADVGLALIPRFSHLGGQAALLVGAVLLNGVASAMYIGARLGPGARDGLMTGLARRTGWPVRGARTGIEVVVLGAGWLLGGSWAWGPCSTPWRSARWCNCCCRGSPCRNPGPQAKAKPGQRRKQPWPGPPLRRRSFRAPSSVTANLTAPTSGLRSPRQRLATGQ